MALGEKEAVIMALKPAAEGNLAALDATGQLQDSAKQVSDFAPAPLHTTLTLYINADTGNDSHSGLSAAQAKKTLAAMLASIPRDLGGNTVTIHLCGTFSEQLTFQDFHNGELLLSGSPESPAVFTNSGTVNLNNAHITLQYLHISGSQFTHALVLRDNQSIALVECTFDASSGGNGPLLQRNGNALLNNCVINNAANVALLSNSGVVAILNLSGSNNGVAIKTGNSFYKESGITLVTGISIGANIQFQIETGGVIFNNGELYGGA